MRNKRLGVIATAAALAGVTPPCALATQAYSARELFTFAPPPGYERVFFRGGPMAGQVFGDVVSQPDPRQQALGYPTVWDLQGNPTILATNNPAFAGANILATSGTQQVGDAAQLGANGLTTGRTDAVLWNGTGSSPIDLHPNNLSALARSNTTAVGTDGRQQVGYAYGGNLGVFSRALLWNGTPDAVDLTPASGDAVATGVAGGVQVGIDHSSDGGRFVTHALLWRGTAASVVNLHPTQFDRIFQSRALGTDGVQQAGAIDLDRADGGGSYTHAALWSGTAGSAIDLHPTFLRDVDASSSSALATLNGIQVGWAIVDGQTPTHAMMWHGTPDSAVDLGALLPGGLSQVQSIATSVDAAGNVFGYVQDDQFNYHIYEWSALPEPVTAWLVIPAMFLLTRRRRHGWVHASR